MQMRSTLFILTVFFTFIHSYIAVAASNKNDKGQVFSVYELKRWDATSKQFSDRYEGNIRDIRSGRVSLENKIYELRAYYPYAKYYDPFSKKLVDQMMLYAYTVDTSKDRGEVNKALDSFRDLVYKHIVNLGVVDNALKLSQLNPRLGDSVFFKKVRDLIRSTLGGMGNVGTDPDHAYKVITYAEEIYILETYGATIEKSEIYEVADQFFDVRDIVTEDGENMQLFFDVTQTIRNVNLTNALAEHEAKTFIALQ